MSMKPFPMNLNFKTGELTPNDRTNIRKLSDMKGMFLDSEAERRILQKGNPPIYSFSEKVLPEENGHLQLATTTIHPGKVGDEYHMTKGHYHRRPDTSEVYLGVEGEGCLLTQTVRENLSLSTSGPGCCLHSALLGTSNGQCRMKPFIFFAVYPGDAGHNYGDIERTGFVKTLVERDGKPFLIDNPKWKRR